MASVHTAIFAVLGAIMLTCGVILTRIAYRAARRTHWHTLRVVALGFALLTLGGFATLIYAIYATSEPTTTASS